MPGALRQQRRRVGSGGGASPPLRTNRAPWAPFTAIGPASPGLCAIDKSATQAFIEANPGAAPGQPTAYVSPAGGAPGTAALNDPTKPFSLDYALRTLTGVQRIVLMDGTYPPTQLRNTDAAGAIKKLVIAQNPEQVTLQVPGEDLSAKTFTATTGGHPDVWQTSYTGIYGGMTLHRLCRTDVLDAWSYPERFRRCASLAILDAEPRGYFVDTAAKVIYVKWNAVDINTIKAALKPYWLDNAGNSRIYLQNAEVAFDGIQFEGMGVHMLSSTATRPAVWLNNCQIVCAHGGGINDFGQAEAYAYLTDVRIHATENDGVNLNANVALPGTAQVALGRCHVSHAGDISGLGENGSANKQAVSMHAGRIAAFGCTFEQSYGQEIADTSLDPDTNESWYVGCLAKRLTAAPFTSEGFGFYGAAASGAGNPKQRKAWLESCGVVGPIVTPLRAQDFAAVWLANCPTLTATVVGGSIAPGSYVP